MMKTFRKTILASMMLGAVVLAPMSVSANADGILAAQGMPTLAPMIEKVRPAVVSIAVEGKTERRSSRSRNRAMPEEFEFFFGRDFFAEQGERPFKGIGSGVIIDAQKGYVVTNNHVINNADKISLKLEDGREFKAKLVGADPLSDVALLQIEDPRNLTAIKLADSDKMRVGDFTVAIGNPFGLGQTVTSGIVSALGRSTGNSDEGYESYIQTDAAVNQGNSGGPLINLNGELIGINTAIISPSGGNAGIAFAIPSNMVSNLTQQIIEFGEIRRGMLGIRGGELNAEMAKAFNIDTQQGAFISEVLPDSSAEKAGLKAGDVITALNGQKIQSFSELRAKVATSGAGKEIEITYLRDGKSSTAKVVLQSDKQAQSNAKDLIPHLKGIELSNYKADDVHGVEVTKVEKGSAAEMRGLRKGDIIIGINRRGVSNLAELRKLLDSDISVMALHILRGNSTLYLILQ